MTIPVVLRHEFHAETRAQLPAILGAIGDKAALS